MGRGRAAPQIIDGDWTRLRQVIARLSAMILGSEASSTYAGLTLTDLTASRLIATDADKALASVGDLTLWIAGTSNRISVANDGDGSVTLSTPQDIHTGASPQFTGIELGHVSDTTLTRASAGNLNIEGNLVYRAGGTDVPIGDGGTGQSTAQEAIDILSAVSGATNEHVLTKDTASGNAVWKASTGGNGGGQTQGDVLDDLNTLGANPFSGDPNKDFLTGTAAGTLAWESGATVRTSLGLGTGDSPIFTGVTLNNTGLHLLDTNASHDLIIKPGSDLTADKTLTLTTGDSDRIITLSGNPTLDDWFDQSVKIAASPQFTGIELGHASDTTIARASAGNLSVEGKLIYRADGTDVPVADGGTGQSTALAGFDALSPMTTIGDILYGGASGTGTRLAKGTAGKVLTMNSGATAPEWATGGATVYELPSMRLDTYVHADFVGHLEQIHTKNANIEFGIRPYVHGLGADIPQDNAYRGAVYSPTQNRIYFVPFNQGDVAKWHYVDCNDGSIVAYTHGVTAVNSAYIGGVYSPTENRIYLIPYGQSDVADWHYIDCDDGSVVAYAHGLGGDIPVDSAYIGGIYSPNQNRIYLVPYNQSNQAKWHYIDCSDGSIVAYTHGATAVAGAYTGGAYSPTQDRIYFAPYGQATESNWHYIDCSDGSIDAYAHGLGGDTPEAGAYHSGVYSPTENRIYFVPYLQADVAKWHYIDCSDGSAVAYTHGATAVNGAYAGGVYSPTQDKIYFVPYIQANNATWHYIDCSDGSIVAYTHGATVDSFGYYGGVYSPTQNEIYFVPYKAANDAAWHTVKHFSLAEISPSIAASPLFNKW